MRIVEKYLIILYFFICPLEMALNIIFGSTTKYVGMLILAIWGMDYTFQGGKDVAINPQIKAIVLWLTICVVSSLMWGTHSNYTIEYITTYLQMGLFLFICQEEKWSSGEINAFIFSYWLGSLIVAFLVIFFGDAKYNGRETILLFGRYCDPNQIAANIIPGACISFWTISKNDSRLSFSIICFGALVATSYSVLLTGSRGGLLGLLAVIGLIIITGIAKQEIKFQYVVIVALIIFIIIYKNPSLLNMRAFDFDSYVDTYSNGGNRITIWKTLLKSFDAKWLVGHGVGSSIAYFYAIYQHAVSVHNTFLLVLYETGIVGFIFFIYPFLSMILYHWKRGNSIFMALIIAAMICSFFLDALNLRYIWNGLLLAIMKYNAESVSNNKVVEAEPVYKYIR